MQSLFSLDTRVNNKQIFNSLEECREYDINMRSSALISYQKPVQRISKYAIEGATIAEIGVNTGLLSLHLAGKRPDTVITGIEENAHLLQVAEENLTLSSWAGLDTDIEYEQCKFTRLPFDDDEFDVVCSFSSLHLWSDPAAVLKECARICKPDGVVLIEDLNRHAEEGYISFVLQFVSDGADKFMAALRKSFTLDEVSEFLRLSDLEHWEIQEVDLGLIISSKSVQA